MTYKHTITVGDWSKDGHNQSDDLNIESNKNKEEILSAYEKTCKQLGLRLDGYNKTKEQVVMLQEYEDDHLSKEQVDTLKNAGVDFSDFDSEVDYDGTLCCCVDDVAKLFLEMAKVNLPDLTYKFVTNEVLMRGIGYGCYRN